jgi:uncharacterized protein (UPF0276 family)
MYPVPSTMSSSFQEAKRRSSDRCGVGVGLRWEFLDEVLESAHLDLPFWEVSPENYMRRGGFFPEALERLRERYPFVCHGLSMSVGSIDPPPTRYLEEVRAELTRMQSPWHSDHLCLSTAGPLALHELLPLPLTQETVIRVAGRIRLIEDTLGLPFAVENISFYAHPDEPELSELDFLCEVLHRSDAGLLLDVNNTYVNAQNHGYDALEFIRQLPHERVVQLHIAGHTVLGEEHPAAGLLLDTHGTPVIDPVKQLFAETLRFTGPVPVLLERDNNLPELSVLLAERNELQRIFNETLSGDPGEHH